ncbi:hypothetical protein M514_01095 [Trichuris suis]|uniref:Uncharacterized protein n=1 Tax=Trichuris suis TaxID=68888 RepID=A0A085MZD3_9BILA|nr:hypothetical protein M514_01095 [Trichuris suis]
MSKEDEPFLISNIIIVYCFKQKHLELSRALVGAVVVVGGHEFCRNSCLAEDKSHVLQNKADFVKRRTSKSVKLSMEAPLYDTFNWSRNDMCPNYCLTEV